MRTALVDVVPSRPDRAILTAADGRGRGGTDASDAPGRRDGGCVGRDRRLAACRATRSVPRRGSLKDATRGKSCCARWTGRRVARPAGGWAAAPERGGGARQLHEPAALILGRRHEPPTHAARRIRSTWKGAGVVHPARLGVARSTTSIARRPGTRATPIRCSRRASRTPEPRRSGPASDSHHPHRPGGQAGQLRPLDRCVLEWLRAGAARRSRKAVTGPRAGPPGLAPGSVWSLPAGAPGAFAAQPAARGGAVLTRLDPTRGSMRGWAPYWSLLTDGYHLLGEHTEELQAARRAAASTRRLMLTRAPRRSEALAALGRTCARSRSAVGGVSDAAARAPRRPPRSVLINARRASYGPTATPRQPGRSRPERLLVWEHGRRGQGFDRARSRRPRFSREPSTTPVATRRARAIYRRLLRGPAGEAAPGSGSPARYRGTRGGIRNAALEASARLDTMSDPHPAWREHRAGRRRSPALLGDERLGRWRCSGALVPGGDSRLPSGSTAIRISSPCATTPSTAG